MAKLVDAHVSGACVARHAGSSPAFGTKPAPHGGRLNVAWMLSLFRSIRCYRALSFWILLVTAPGFGAHGMENKVHRDAAVPIKIKGRVLDTQGNPVAYATVVMEPGQWTGLSNENGLYEIMIPAGDYVVYCSHLGYQPLRLNWTLESVSQATAAGPDLVLTLRVVGLQEVTIKAGAEDPAYGYMRKAIAAAPVHSAGPMSYEAETYVKGQFKILEVPWVLKGQLRKQGIDPQTTYVMESASRIRFQRPRKFEEKVLSRRSNLPFGVSSNANLNYSNINLYVARSGDWISPFSSKAFTYYRFEYLGSEDEDGERLHRIRVIPRRQKVNFYEGYVVLRSRDWSLAAADLKVVNPGGDRYQIGKQFRRVQGVSMQCMEDLRIQVGMLGASASIRYISSIRNFKQVVVGPPITGTQPAYSAGLASRKVRPKSLSSSSSKPNLLNPNSPIQGNIPNSLAVKDTLAVKDMLAVKDSVEQVESLAAEDSLFVEGVEFSTKDEFDAEYVFEVDEQADVAQNSLWDSLRTISLDSSELQGYLRGDSLRLVNRENERRDSLRSVAPFGIRNLWETFRRQRGKNFPGKAYSEWELTGLRQHLFGDWGFYNPLEGWVWSTRFRHLSRDERNLNREWNAGLRWGTQRHQWLPSLQWSQYNAEYRLNVKAGITVDPLGQAIFNQAVHLYSGLRSGFRVEMPTWDMNARTKNYSAYSGLEGIRTARFQVNLEQRLHLKWRMWLGLQGENRQYWLQNANTDSSLIWASSLWFRPSQDLTLLKPVSETKGIFTDHHKFQLNAGWRWEPMTERRRFNGWTRYRRTDEVALGLDLSQAWVRPMTAGNLPAGEAPTNLWKPWTKVQVYVDRKANLGADRVWHGYAVWGGFLQRPTQFADWHHWSSASFGLGPDATMAIRGLNPYSLSSSTQWLGLMQEYSSERLVLTRWKGLAKSRAVETLHTNWITEPGRMMHAEAGWKLSRIYGGLGLDIFHFSTLFQSGKVFPVSANPLINQNPNRWSGWGFRLILSL